MPDAETARRIEAMARRLGFDAVGFCLPQSRPEWRLSLEDYSAGDMEYMQRNSDLRTNPQKIWEPVKTIIVLAMNYYHNPLPASPERGAFSVYAYGADYHDFIKKQLKSLAAEIERCWGAQSRVYCDTAPVMEKQLARMAGIGWQAKNSIICSRQLGNCFFLGEIFTELAVNFPEPQPCSGACGNCQRCREACPTGALHRPYRVDVPRCIAYLTIEHKGLIPEELRPLIGSRIYGCDTCLQVCPWNKFARETSQLHFAARRYLNLPLENYLNLDDSAFREMFRASAVKRIGWGRFMRNVLIAVGNSGCKQYLPKVQKFVTHENEVISQTALWARKRLEEQ